MSRDFCSFYAEDLPPLVQRQQRRALSHVSKKASVDSWDFATTVHSTHRRFLDRHGLEGADDSDQGSRQGSVLSQTRPILIARRSSQVTSPSHNQENNILEAVPSSMSDIAASPLMTTDSSTSESESPPSSISELEEVTPSPTWKPSSMPTMSATTKPITIQGHERHKEDTQANAISSSVSSKIERKSTGMWKKFKGVAQLSRKSSSKTSFLATNVRFSNVGFLEEQNP
jgi:hypothetical protein